MPKVSILMPIYNTKEEYLREAIESVLNQTFQDYEFIILNNSPANTDLDQVVGSYKDSRIRYVKSEKDTGISEGRNKLIELAKGEYLAVLDHDDICLPTRLEEEVKVLDEHPEIGVVGTLYERFPKSKEASKLAEFSDAIEQHLMEGCAVLHPSSMIRASVLKEHNIRYEEEFTPAEDYALWCRLIGKTKFYNIQKVLMKYRWHEDNASTRQAEKMAVATKAIHEFVRTAHPDIWKNVCENAPHVVRMKLFRLIPLSKFIQQGNKRKGILRYLPFITTKMKLEVK